MSRNFVSTAAVVLAAAAWLAACDKTKAPSPTTSPAPVAAVPSRIVPSSPDTHSEAQAQKTVPNAG